MTKFSSLIVVLFGLGLLLMAWPDSADARRFGGSRSFGSRPSYSKSFQKPSAPLSSPTKQATPGTSPMRGRGMFGGMLGGMLMGGLLGSLFFGGPFNGISFIDILLLGGGLFLLTRLLRSRQSAPQASGGPGNVHDMDRGAWDHLRSTQHQQAASQADNFPPGFNAEEFLQGAKAAYTRLQASWDARDMEDLRHFTSPEVFAEIETQAASDPNPGKTEILLLEAKLLEVKSLGNQTVATVLFDTMLREDSASAPAEQVREAWHFSRYDTTGDSHWVVEGIQQLEQ